MFPLFKFVKSSNLGRKDSIQGWAIVSCSKSIKKKIHIITIPSNTDNTIQTSTLNTTLPSPTPAPPQTQKGKVEPPHCTIGICRRSKARDRIGASISRSIFNRYLCIVVPQPMAANTERSTEDGRLLA